MQPASKRLQTPPQPAVPSSNVYILPPSPNATTTSIRSLLGALRWQRANRPSTFTLLVPRPPRPRGPAADAPDADDPEATESEAEEEEAAATAPAEVDVQATFPVGIALAEPRRARPGLRAAVLRLTGGAATEAQQRGAWAAYRQLWGSHAHVPLARVPFMRFDRGIQVQRALRLTDDGMGDPARRRERQEEVKGMDAVARMLLPVTASLLRDGRLPVLAPPGVKREGAKGAKGGKKGPKRRRAEGEGEGKGRGGRGGGKGNAKPRAKEEDGEDAAATAGGAGAKGQGQGQKGKRKGGKESHEVAMIMIGMEQSQSQQPKPKQKQQKKGRGAAGAARQQGQQELAEEGGGEDDAADAI